jgi:lipoprotein NlpD
MIAFGRRWFAMFDGFPKALRIMSAVLCLLAVSCSDALRWAPEYYVVQPGDTLYSIAFGYRFDQRDLAAWNNLGSGRVIYPGQKLRMSGPANAGAKTSSGSSSASSRKASRSGTKASPVAAWQWPTDGSVVSAYGASSKTQAGIQIGGRRGQAVRAAAPGEVVYSGNGLPGYGQLLIIKHNEDFLSAYGHNDSLSVAEGKNVKMGQQIARMGNGPGQKPVLHFEIRRRGQPVDPVGYLPRR